MVSGFRRNTWDGASSVLQLATSAPATWAPTSMRTADRCSALGTSSTSTYSTDSRYSTIGTSTSPHPQVPRGHPRVDRANQTKEDPFGKPSSALCRLFSRVWESVMQLVGVEHKINGLLHSYEWRLRFGALEFFSQNLSESAPNLNLHEFAMKQHISPIRNFFLNTHNSIHFFLLCHF